MSITPELISPDKLADILGVTLPALETISSQVHHLFRMEDRVIKGKTRLLSIPDEKLKSLQKQLYKRLLAHLPIHDAAYCRTGRGVVDAVQRHQWHPYLLHLDIKNFFPSTSAARVASSFRRFGFPTDTVTLLTKLTTYRRQLPQGAPTSVAVGNLVLARLDESLAELCRQYGLTYTRYVDDLAISGGRRTGSVEGKVRRIVQAFKWELSPKGGLFRAGESRKLLGIMLGKTLTADPVYLSDVEQETARILTAEQIIDERELRQIRGRIAWITLIEPEIGRRLERSLSGVAVTTTE